MVMLVSNLQLKVIVLWCKSLLWYALFKLCDGALQEIHVKIEFDLGETMSLPNAKLEPYALV